MGLQNSQKQERQTAKGKHNANSELQQENSSIHQHPSSIGEPGCSNASEISEQRRFAMSGIMEVLTEGSAFIIGIYGTETATMADLVEKVSRRAERDNLFDKVIRVSITRKPDMKMIQEEVAAALGFTMNEKSDAKRATLLRDRIKMEHKILVVLQNLNKGLDLGKLGIPFGDDHTGCKIILTCTSREILSNHMKAHKVIQA